MVKNYGYLPEKEIADRSVKDWIFGAISARCIAEIPPEERIPYLPAGEKQYSEEGDMMDCATRGPVNMIETKLNWLIKENKLKANTINFLKQFMNEQGQIEISDAYTAITSGTTRAGNSAKAPLDAIRTKGIVPKKLLPLEKWMNWYDFHNPARITAEIKKIGEESLQYLNFNYERVLLTNVGQMLDRDVLDLSGFAWPEPINGEYPRTEEEANHIFMGLKNPPTYIFDNYLDRSIAGDFIKKLTSNYLFHSAYRIIISENMTPVERLTLMAQIYQRLIEITQQLIEAYKQLSLKVAGFFKGLIN